MRRAWLLALLATPAVSAAQTVPAPTRGSGDITLATQVNTAVDEFINAAECLDGTIKLQWSPVYVTTPTAKSAADLGSYQVYASDQPTVDAVKSGDCPTTNGDKGVTGLHAGAVSDRITGAANLIDPSPVLEFDTALIASVAGLGACNVSDTNIMVCVQARDLGGNPIGTARRTLIVSTKSPNAPESASVTSGENALNVRWGDSPGLPEPEYHIAEAVIDPTVDPSVSTTTVVASSGPVPGAGANDVRLEGLENGVVYAVYVTAYSTADNPSDPIFAGTAAAAEVNDFWETYRAAGGREQGGCGPGAAGPLALLGAVSLLALLRRRK